MKNLSNRRAFLKNISLLGVGTLLGNSIFAQNISNELIDNTLLEILGIQKPFLCQENNSELRVKASQAFHDMKYDALRDGIAIYCSSSYRSFNLQNGIWKRKFNKLKATEKDESLIIKTITEYSSIPGTSRHHWGTDIDMIDALGCPEEDALLSENYSDCGPYAYLGYWLKNNAHKYGYHITYTSNDFRPGFRFEPWHYSFKEDSIPFLKLILEADLYCALSELPILGKNNFTQEFIDNYKAQYILGINPDLIPIY